MKSKAIYHQLGLYLLSIDSNIHPGACACASAAIHEMPDILSTVCRKIESKIRAWYGEYLLGSTRETFTSKTKCDVTPIISALESSCDELHIVGHDVIQSSYAMKSLHALGQYAPQTVVDKIASNVRKNGKAHPGMFYGYTSEEIRKVEDTFVAYDAESTPNDVAASLIKTLKKIKKSYFGFEFLAQETHLITHAEAMISLHALGHHDLFRRLLKGWFLRIKLLETIFDLDLKNSQSPSKATWDPRTATFWEAYSHYQLYIHPIKTMFSYLNLKHYGLFSQEDARFMEEEKLPFMADSRFPADW